MYNSSPSGSIPLPTKETFTNYDSSVKFSIGMRKISLTISYLSWGSDGYSLMARTERRRGDGPPVEVAVPICVCA